MKPRVWGVSCDGQRYGMAFDCPGCTRTHVVNVARYDKAPANFPVWRWNESIELPTFEPSLLVTVPKMSNGVEIGGGERCHSFVRDGRIQFLSDCTHALAGQTVDLPIVPDDKEW